MSLVVSIQIRRFLLEDLGLGVVRPVFSFSLSIGSSLISDYFLNDLIHLLSINLHLFYCHFLVLPDNEEHDSPDQANTDEQVIGFFICFYFIWIVKFENPY